MTYLRNELWRLDTFKIMKVHDISYFKTQRFKTLSVNKFEYKDLMNNCVGIIVTCMVYHLGNQGSNYYVDTFIKYFYIYFLLRTHHFSQ